MNTKKSKLTFVKGYSIDYLIKNPSTNAQGLRYVWQAAVIEYMKEQGVDVADKSLYSKPIQGIDFSHITRIFQNLVKQKAKAAPAAKAKTKRTKAA